jgi:hypothetical protein
MDLARYEPGTAALLFYYGASASCVAAGRPKVAYAVKQGTTTADVELLRSIVPEECLKVRAPIKKHDLTAPKRIERFAVACDLWKADQLSDESTSKELAQVLFLPEIE